MKRWAYNLLASLMVVLPPLGFTIGSIIAYDMDSAYDHVVIAEHPNDEAVKIYISPFEVSDNLTFDQISKSESVLGGLSVAILVRQPIVLTSASKMKLDKDFSFNEVIVKEGQYIKIYAGDVIYSPEVIFIEQSSIKASSPYISLGFGTLIVSLLGGVIVAQVILKKMGWYKTHPRTATLLALGLGTLVLWLINAIVGNLLGVFGFALVGWIGYCGLYTYDTKLYPLIEAKKIAKQAQKPSDKLKADEVKGE